jgi:hypothetical protein
LDVTKRFLPQKHKKRSYAYILPILGHFVIETTQREKNALQIYVSTDPLPHTNYLLNIYTARASRGINPDMPRAGRYDRVIRVSSSGTKVSRPSHTDVAREEVRGMCGRDVRTGPSVCWCWVVG